MALSPAKHWCFTVNNPPTELDSLAEESNIVYAVWQMELAPDTQTPHYQGYLILADKKRMAWLTSLFPHGTHFEIARGSPKQNREYCTKPDTRIGDFWEIGLFPESTAGKRTDLQALKRAFDSGLSEYEYATRHFETFQRNPKLLQHYKSATLPSRDPSQEVSVHLLLGPPGFGKSRYASFIGHRDGFYRHTGTDWFDGYFGQRGIIFDDFAGHCLSLTTFKRVCDRYPVLVQVKGGFIPMGATEFIFTANEDPEQWWKTKTQVALEAVKRRFTKIWFFFSENRFEEFHSYLDYSFYHGGGR